jgi:exodeoxyribonuclease VII large subunit
VPTDSAQREVYSVSRLTAEVRLLLEGQFPLIWVEGEISNLARPGSGHWYFSLKDSAAQVRCAMFRGRNQFLRFRPADGQQVLVRARVSLYEARGEFQLVVEHMEEAGHGALQRAFEALKGRLAAEGLFDAALKRTPPPFPRRLALVTSPTGAAARDVLSVLRRRFPGLEVRLYAVPVQGAGAAERIAAALARAGSPESGCDVIVLTRGGGSLEDLWAFNEEIVARAIRASAVPVVTGVGHEIDFTIADFAADLRAPTPSAAAELSSPDRTELATRFRLLGRRLGQLLGADLRRREERLRHLVQRLQRCHPQTRLNQRAQRLDELDVRLRRAQQRLIEARAARLREAVRGLHAHSPQRRLAALEQQAAVLASRLRAQLTQRLGEQRVRIEALARALHALSPLATLGRGYAIVSRERDGAIVRHSHDVAPDEQLRARLAEGALLCRVEAVEDPAEGPLGDQPA